MSDDEQNNYPRIKQRGYYTDLYTSYLPEHYDQQDKAAYWNQNIINQSKEGGYALCADPDIAEPLQACIEFHGPTSEWTSYLPLEYFDDETFDCRTPSDWLALGIDGGVRKPVPAVCLLPEDDNQHELDIRDPEIKWKWQLAGVLDYDLRSKLWFVQKVDSSGRILDNNGKPIVNGGLLPNGTFAELNTQYWIPRIQLMFLAEDPHIFAERVATAFRDRQQHESALRYNLYLDCMPNEGIGELSNAVLKRMTFLAKDDACSIKKSKGLDNIIQNLEKEVIFDYWRSMNDLILRQLIEKQKNQYRFIQPPEIKKRKIPWKGTLDIPKYDFDVMFQKFSSKSMFNKIAEVRSKSLLHVPLSKHMRIEEFEQTQSMVILQVSMFLKDTWLENFRKHIRTCFRDTGKGWFNIYETDFYVYSQSKLKKFMEMIKFACKMHYVS
ncbi:unnamed protein product [Heterobilharzia americana]|nr:unnamed protein product [Heterobilharzia americana]